MISVEVSFMQWGMEFIGDIHPPSSMQHRWILMTTDYFTKWIEAIPMKQAFDTVIIQFLETNILSRFRCLINIIMDNVTAFNSLENGKVFQGLQYNPGTFYNVLPTG
jgi:hypothetical protein